MRRLSKISAAVATAAVLATSALTSAPAATAAQGDDRAVVDGWYDDFLGRDAEADTGSQYWVDQLQVQAPGDVLWRITHSREYNEREIAGYYNDLLGRAPDAGAQYWVDGTTAQRFPLEWVVQNILASPEFARGHYAASLGETYVVNYWYYNVLDRYDVSDGELQYWANRSARIGRLGSLRELWYSDEAVRNRVNDHYVDLLSRTADFSGLAYWGPKEVESDINVQVLLAATPEYRSKQYSF